MVPEIQKALPRGDGWNRKTSANIIPPRLPIDPTIPLYSWSVRCTFLLLRATYHETVGTLSKRLESYGKVALGKMVDLQGLQCGTKEKLAPFAASQAVARMTSSTITTVTMSPNKALVTAENLATHWKDDDGCQYTNQDPQTIVPA